MTISSKINESEYQKILYPVKTTKDGIVYITLLKCIVKKK